MADPTTAEGWRKLCDRILDEKRDAIERLEGERDEAIALLEGVECKHVHGRSCIFEPDCTEDCDRCSALRRTDSDLGNPDYQPDYLTKQGEGNG